MAETLQYDQEAERAVLGSFLLHGDGRMVNALMVHGLRPDHFYWDQHRDICRAAVSLSDRLAGIDMITVSAEMERLGMATDRVYLDELTSHVPAGGNYRDHADRVISLAKWRDRQAALYKQQQAIQNRDELAFERATVELETATRPARKDSYSKSELASMLFEHFNQPREVIEKLAIPTPFNSLTYALGGGMMPGEWCALSGPTNMGKSIFADQWMDHAADSRGKRCHLYMTEMTALARGMRMLSRRTGVPYMAMRRNDLSQSQLKKILDELERLPYGVSIVSDWDVDDVVRDALNGKYDFVCIDLLHGFHYEDERALDRLSKAVTRLARTSTTLEGFEGTAVLAVTHLKEEGVVRGRVPKPSISSIKGGSSIKQDADFVAFVWRDQEDGGQMTTDGEIWLAKARNSDKAVQPVRLRPSRYRFEVRDQESFI